MAPKLIIATSLDATVVIKTQEALEVQQKLLAAMEGSKTSEEVTGLAKEARKWEGTIDQISAADGIEKSSPLFTTRQRLLEAFNQSAKQSNRQDMLNFSKELRHYETAINKKSKKMAAKPTL